MNGCINLTSLEPIRNWNVSSLSNTIFMFSSCRKLTFIDLIFDRSTSAQVFIDEMFSYTRFSGNEQKIRNNWLRNVQFVQVIKCTQSSSNDGKHDANGQGSNDINDYIWINITITYS